MKRNAYHTPPYVILCLVLALSFALSACGQATPTPQPTAPAEGPEMPASKYNEAPALAALVAAGKLPPVDERLPDNPAVSSAPDIGNYGGFISIGFGNVDQPWNPYVPVDFNWAADYAAATLFNLEASDPAILNLTRLWGRKRVWGVPGGR